MDDKNTWYSWIAVAFVLGLVIGFLAHWLAVRPTNNSVSSDDTYAEMGSTTNTLATSSGVGYEQNSISQNGNSLTVPDQAASSSVAVSSVTLSSPAWVTIEDDNNGVPGNILGAYLFDVGTHSGYVPLLRGTVNGKTYFAVLRKIDADYKNFKPAIDTPMTDANGEPIMVQFTAGNTGSASSDTDQATSTATPTPASTETMPGSAGSLNL